MPKTILDSFISRLGSPTEEEKLLEQQLLATIELLTMIGEIIIFRTNNNIRCEIGCKPLVRNLWKN